MSIQPMPFMASENSILNDDETTDFKFLIERLKAYDVELKRKKIIITDDIDRYIKLTTPGCSFRYILYAIGLVYGKYNCDALDDFMIWKCHKFIMDKYKDLNITCEMNNMSYIFTIHPKPHTNPIMPTKPDIEDIKAETEIRDNHADKQTCAYTAEFERQKSTISGHETSFPRTKGIAYILSLHVKNISVAEPLRCDKLNIKLLWDCCKYIMDTYGNKYDINWTHDGQEEYIFKVGYKNPPEPVVDVMPVEPVKPVEPIIPEDTEEAQLIEYITFNMAKPEMPITFAERKLKLKQYAWKSEKFSHEQLNEYNRVYRKCCDEYIKLINDFICRTIITDEEHYLQDMMWPNDPISKEHFNDKLSALLVKQLVKFISDSYDFKIEFKVNNRGILMHFYVNCARDVNGNKITYV